MLRLSYLRRQCTALHSALLFSVWSGKLDLLLIVQAAGDSTSTSIQLTKEYRLYLHDHLSNHKFLIDSGFVVSLVPKTAVREGSKLGEFLLYAANRTIIRTFGQKTLNLHFDLRRSFKWSYIVADVKWAIIGADFLAHYGLLLDLKGRCLIDPTTSLTSKDQPAETTIHGISTVNQSAESNETD